MKRALLLILCTAALPALAWEGVIDTKMTAGHGDMTMNGTGTITIKGLSARMDQQLLVPGGGTKMTTITRAEEPGVTYMLNEQNKSYQKLDSKSDPAEQDDGSQWTVKRLGKETIAGRSTEHVQLQKKGSSETMEVWIDTQLVSASDLNKAFSRGGGGWWKSLEKAGVAGVPLKFIAHGKEGKDTATWEATKVTAQSVPASTFAIPSGYSEGHGFGGGMGGPPAMNKLTPEQQKQLQDMMQKRQEAGK